MKARVAPLALALLAVTPTVGQVAPDNPPDEPSLSPGQAMMLRCSAAFALVAGDQARGVEPALAYPPLAARGKEFFVRASAQLMDQLHVSREQVQAMLGEQAEQLRRGTSEARDPAAYLASVMQPCLEELEASGL